MDSVDNAVPQLSKSRPDGQLAFVVGGAPYPQAWLVNIGLLQSEEPLGLIRAADVSVASIFFGPGTCLKIL